MDSKHGDGAPFHQGVANSSQIHRQRKERVATWSWRSTRKIEWEVNNASDINSGKAW